MSGAYSRRVHRYELTTSAGELLEGASARVMVAVKAVISLVGGTASGGDSARPSQVSSASATAPVTPAS